MRKLCARLSAFFLISLMSAPAGFKAGRGSLGYSGLLKRQDLSSVQTDKDGYAPAADTVCNGDKVKPGYGCVTGELKDYDLYKAEYAAGIDPAAKLLMLSEDLNKGAVYLFVYRADPALAYDSVDLSTSLEKDPDGDYIESFKTGLKLEPVSVSAGGFLVKYLIEGLTCDNDDPVRRYAVRQIYNSKTEAVISSIIPVALEYVVQRGEDGQYYSAVDSMNLNIVSEKEVFFSLLNQDKKMFQDYFIAFNTTVELADIVRAEVVYDYADYNCQTTIKNSIGDTGYAGLKEGFQGLTTCKADSVLPVKEAHGVTSIIDKSAVQFDSRGSAFGVWFAPLGLVNYLHTKKSYQWSTIEKPSIASAPELQKYSWLLHFSDMNDPAWWFSFDWKTGTLPGFENYYRVEGARHIGRASILQLWYQEDGLIKKAIVTDTYTDTSGNINKDPAPRSLWRQIVDAFTKVFAGTAGFFDWVLFVLTLTVALMVLAVVAKFIKLIIAVFK